MIMSHCGECSVSHSRSRRAGFAICNNEQERTHVSGNKKQTSLLFIMMVNPSIQGSTGHSERFTFTGKERDEETGFGYFGVRYMDHELMTMWLSVDPLADKYPSISPYAYCVWNPVKLTDPDGMDTLNVTYNNTTKRWDIGTLVIAQGNDVINVTKSNGLTGSVVFSEGEYGKRICNVTLEDNGQQTLSVFMLAGEGVAGYAVEPSGVADNSKSYLEILSL